MPSWIEALAMWRASGGSGKIPAKGSAEYNKVKAMMGGSGPKAGAVKEGYAKITRPTKKGVARYGSKAGAKFTSQMEKEFFSKPDVVVGPRGGIKQMPKPAAKPARKKRADAGMKRGHKKGSKAGDKFMAEMEEKFF
jgi:hypothetical protein